MARQVGFTSQTKNNLVLGAGRLVANFGKAGQVALGASRGGAVATITQTYRTAEVDGTVGMVKGLRRIIEADVQLTATLVEFDESKLLQLLPGAVSADTQADDVIVGDADIDAGDHKKITRSGDLSDADYLDNVALVYEVASKNDPGVFLITNVLQDGPIAITTEDDGEATVPVQFTGHYLASDPENEPWAIYMPKA